MRTARIHGPLLLSAALTILLVAVVHTQRAPGAYRGWAGYGGGPEQIRYSSLTQINKKNVKQLQVAWTYDTGEGGDLQTQPIAVDGVLYAYSPLQRVLALDAATGAVKWTFDAKLQGRGPNRGVMYWPGGGSDGPRILAPVHEYVYALDAKTGAVVTTFGDGGR